MNIVIPTLNRPAHLQTTIKRIAPLAPVYVVCNEKDRDALAPVLGHGNIEYMVPPPHVEGIGPVRQFIVEQVGDHPSVLMMDDDLVFFHRRADEPGLLRDITDEELLGFLTQTAARLEHDSCGPALVGWAAREGANRCTDNVMVNTRILRVLGYRRAPLREHNIRFDRVPVMEDFDVALQLLRKGYSNLVINWIAHNQRGSGSEGGCSTYRTLETQETAARMLRNFHPQFVTVVEKTTKTAWGGGTRVDVKIAWKKAYGYDIR